MPNTIERMAALVAKGVRFDIRRPLQGSQPTEVEAIRRGRWCYKRSFNLEVALDHVCNTWEQNLAQETAELEAREAQAAQADRERLLQEFVD
jgi:hypothetical protein